jgi:hypothetical protein
MIDPTMKGMTRRQNILKGIWVFDIMLTIPDSLSVEKALVPVELTDAYPYEQCRLNFAQRLR